MTTAPAPRLKYLDPKTGQVVEESSSSDEEINESSASESNSGSSLSSNRQLLLGRLGIALETMLQLRKSDEEALTPSSDALSPLSSMSSDALSPLSATVESHKTIALSKFLDGVVTTHVKGHVFMHADQEYLVFTDDEADDFVKERITDDIWLFNASTIAQFIKIIPAPGIKAMQDALGNECATILVELIGDRMDEFIYECTSTDGRGHFISGYDGEEYEQNGFFIYKM